MKGIATGLLIAFGSTLLIGELLFFQYLSYNSPHWIMITSSLTKEPIFGFGTILAMVSTIAATIGLTILACVITNDWIDKYGPKKED